MYVKSDLIHDGVHYKKGDEVNFDASISRKLVADGVLTSKRVLSDEEENAPEEVVDEEGAEDDAADEEEVEEQRPAPAPEAPKPAVEKYNVTEQDLVNNPALAEQGMAVGQELFLTPEAIAQVSTPGYLTSILAKSTDASDNL